MTLYSQRILRPMKKNKVENNQNKKQSKTLAKLSKHAILVVVAVNLALLLVNGLILSLIPNLVEAIIVERSEIIAQELQNQSAQKLLTDIQAGQADIAKIEKVLPNKTQLLEVIELFESLKDKVNVQSFNFERETPAQDADGFTFLPLSLVLEGNLPQTMSALHTLQKAPYIFTVNQTLIESPEGLSNAITVRVRLRIYVNKPFTEN